MIRLMIADDHALFRDALVHYIERSEPETVIMLARDLHEVMEIMEGDPDLDIILLDFRMPGMNGVQGIEKLRKTYPDTNIALMSGLAEQDDVEKALAMGVKGYFPKTMSGKAMLNGIHQILKGEVYVAMDHNTNSIMPTHYNGSDTGQSGNRWSASANDGKNGANLTPREREVLSYLLNGASNKDIARSLDLQVVTVKLHVRGICRKLGVKNRTQAALKAQELGVVNS